ncbi:MAG: hypothetical protein K2X47_02900 [Bdellovibrionales bacterium]|nr:hypothetical protein [Bdellovibrionales bacterium]
MKWKKRGLIFDPKLIEGRGLTAALMPIAEVLDADKNLIRVYFSPRNSLNKSEVHYFDIDIQRPQNILRVY